MQQDVNFHSHPSRVEHWRHVIEIAAIVVAAAWAFYVFVYQERIKPATAKPELLHTITVEHSALGNGKEFVKVAAEFKNVGISDVQLDGVIVNVYGIHYGSNAGKQIEQPMSGIDKTNFGLTASRPVPLYSFFDEWPSMGAKKPASPVISPGLTWTESFAFAIHAGQYDSVNILFYVCYSRPTSHVWTSPEIREPDGTSRWQLPKEPQGLDCTYQRSGLVYPL
jgi:hypothetical protein